MKNKLGTMFTLSSNDLKQQPGSIDSQVLKSNRFNNDLSRINDKSQMEIEQLGLFDQFNNTVIAKIDYKFLDRIQQSNQNNQFNTVANQKKAVNMHTWKYLKNKSHQSHEMFTTIAKHHKQQKSNKVVYSVLCNQQLSIGKDPNHNINCQDLKQIVNTKEFKKTKNTVNDKHQEQIQKQIRNNHWYQKAIQKLKIDWKKKDLEKSNDVSIKQTTSTRFEHNTKKNFNFKKQEYESLNKLNNIMGLENQYAGDNKKYQNLAINVQNSRNLNQFNMNQVINKAPKTTKMFVTLNDENQNDSIDQYVNKNVNRLLTELYSERDKLILYDQDQYLHQQYKKCMEQLANQMDDQCGMDSKYVQKIKWQDYLSDYYGQDDSNQNLDKQQKMNQKCYKQSSLNMTKFDAFRTKDKIKKYNQMTDRMRKFKYSMKQKQENKDINDISSWNNQYQ